MHVSVAAAKAQLSDLVRRAERGNEIVLTRHGHPVVRLVPARARFSAQEKRALLESVRASAARKAKRGSCAARSQDFLYDKYGLPK
ncbi:MAG: type II toxin-antitoxin system Phd/YefM family antitoxin [Hyphomicrobiales bacterium]|nr:type II toxin-antitoxin system Phd/YefM family antitoxin [Hyphomicrobiales bacterium]